MVYIEVVTTRFWCKQKIAQGTNFKKTILT